MAVKKIGESIAAVEEELFKAEQEGNTRKAKALKLILKRLRKIKSISK